MNDKTNQKSPLGGSSLDDLFRFPNGEIVKSKILKSSDRIGRAFSELFSGYSRVAEDILNITTEVDEYSGIVIMRDIKFYTYCEHHFAPFFGYADVAYHPNHIITGLGKIVRLVRDVHARRLQIQELMNRDIASDVMRVLDAKGVFVSTRAKHLCICSRGPGDDEAWTEVDFGLGTLANSSSQQIFGVRSESRNLR